MPQCGKCHRDAAATALYCASCGAPIVPDQTGEVDPFIGKTFRGVYFVQQKVGGGGMGQVYKALHITLDVPVALKILNRQLLGDPTTVQRFHREARAASRLRHPNVISVTDFGQSDDGVLFMAMEYVDGKSLARVIHEEFPLSEQRVVRIGAQILSALAEAHASQILHRDLKPENVMLEPRRDQPDSVKVVDFGIAKIQLPGEGQSTLTSKGLVCGTPGYMSPEQWSDEALDGRSDLYSVGVILYEMLTGLLPFEARTPMELVRKHLTEDATPPSARRADHAVSGDLEGLVMRAISTNRDERPPTAEEMREELIGCVLLPELAETDPSRPTPRRTQALPSMTPGQSPSASAARGSGGHGAPGPPSPRASARAGRTPSVTERLPPPHQSPRRTPAGSGQGRRATTPPMVPGPPRRSRAPIIFGSVLGLLALLAVAVFFKHRPSPAPPDPVAAAAASGPRERASPEPIAHALAEPAPLPVSEPPPRAEIPDPPRRPEPALTSPLASQPPAKIGTAPPGKGRPKVVGKATGLFYARDVLNSIPTPDAVSGDGVLSVLADPYGEVSIDGRLYGEAPREFRLPAGTYLVSVSHPGAGRRETSLTIRAGERARWVATFSKLRGKPTAPGATP